MQGWSESQNNSKHKNDLQFALVTGDDASVGDPDDLELDEAELSIDFVESFVIDSTRDRMEIDERVSSVPKNAYSTNPTPSIKETKEDLSDSFLTSNDAINLIQYVRTSIRLAEKGTKLA